MKTSIIASFSLLLFFAVLRTSQAHLRERREASPEITVTLKLDWNVTALGKPIPPSYTTMVPNGTVVMDIMNKAAAEDKEGPFNLYESTYYAGLGYLITTINGTEHSQNTNSYWYKYDEENVSIPCGGDSYVPHNGSTILFRFTADPYPNNNKSANGYCVSHSTPSQESPSAITVTIGMEWNTDVVKKSIPAPYTTKVASNTNLKEIINKAADKNPKGPFNKYSTTYYGGQGHFITAMNGTKEDSKTDSYWMIYDKKAKKLFKPFVDQYKPQDGSTTILKLITGQEPDHSCGCNFTGMGLVVLCLLTSVETLWFC